MKYIRIGLHNNNRWVLKLFMVLLCLLFTGCTKGGEDTFKVDRVETATSVTLTDGLQDWRNYVTQKSFTSGYSGEFWVMFNFSNVLHDGKINFKANIYIVSDGDLISEENKEAAITDSSDNKLWWGNLFDISMYPDGDYSAIVTVTDLISGTSASLTTAFKIGSTQ